MVTLCSLNILAAFLFCQLTFAIDLCPRYPISDEYPLFMLTLSETGSSDCIFCAINQYCYTLIPIDWNNIKMYSFTVKMRWYFIGLNRTP